MGNTKLSVDVTQSFANGVVTESIKTHGEEVDKEQYKLDDYGLSLMEASDDVFAPALPLFKFSPDTPEALTWSGVVQEGPTNRQATAQIKVEPEDISFVDHTEKGIHVHVVLSIDSGTPVPSQRNFDFWITAHGVVKRSFGEGTARSIAGLQEK